MNTEQNRQNMELPTPKQEPMNIEAPSPHVFEKTEQSMAMQSEHGQSAGAPPSVTQTVPQQSSAHQATRSSQPSPQAAVPLMADDVDLIEKEWVDIAKQIIDRTKADPHQQNIALNKVKADYIQKRYQKNIKVDES